MCVTGRNKKNWPQNAFSLPFYKSHQREIKYEDAGPQEPVDFKRRNYQAKGWDIWSET